MATCNKDHAAGSLPATFASLPESQAAKWRHICAGCAYELGRTDGAKTEENLRERVRKLTEENDHLRAQLAAKKS
jgi:hypothetical protein